jgi:hypothetical protein
VKGELVKNVQIGIARRYCREKFEDPEYKDLTTIQERGGFATLFKSLRAWMFEHKAKATVNITYDTLKVLDSSVSWTSGTLILRNGVDVLQTVKENLTGKVIIRVVQQRERRHKMKIGSPEVTPIHTVSLGFTRPRDAMIVKMILQ